MREHLRHPQFSTVGLVAYYKLWAGLYDGTNVFDYSLNGFVGIPAGTDVEYAYPGFTFNGTDDSIDVAGDPTGVKTLMAWVKPDDIAGADYPLDLNDTDYMVISTGTLILGGFSGSKLTYVDGVSGTDVTANWHLIAGTDPIGGNATSLTIGRKTTSPFFAGKIGEVMLFDRVLSPAEIKSIYELTKWRYPNNN
jgi:hypothetical protein